MQKRPRIWTYQKQIKDRGVLTKPKLIVCIVEVDRYGFGRYLKTDTDTDFKETDNRLPIPIILILPIPPIPVLIFFVDRYR